MAEQDRQREGAVEPLEHLGDRLLRRLARLDLLGHEMGHDLGIGLAGEDAAARDQLVPQRLEILDDAVVDQRHLLRGMRVSIVLGRRTMGRPARMGDAGVARQRILIEHLGEIVELAGCAPAIDHAIMIGGDAGRIIAAIFEPAQPREQAPAHIFLTDDSDDAAHSRPLLKPHCRPQHPGRLMAPERRPDGLVGVYAVRPE